MFSSHSLATETELVRATLAAYANDLISLGVDGLRLDAAKSNLFYVLLATPPLSLMREKHHQILLPQTLQI